MYSISLWSHWLCSVFVLGQDEFPVPEVFPVQEEFPPVLKWRRKSSAVSVSSSLPDLRRNSASGLNAVDTPFPTDKPLEGERSDELRLTSHFSKPSLSKYHGITIFY